MSTTDSSTANPPTPAESNTSPLPSPQRYITTHNADGKAIFSTALPDELPPHHLPNAATFHLGYLTPSLPPVLSSSLSTSTSTSTNSNPNPKSTADTSTPPDLTLYTTHLPPHPPPSLTIPNGSVLRYVDMPPHSLSPMHRTVSLDYGIVLEGEVELVLDSGETRVMRKGDLAVQRATMHAWRNSGEGWVRMVFVLLALQQEEGMGREEDLGGMEGVPGSRADGK
ncbi:hypothetical protein K402DRAFT_119761 [Aulographum hederae CBS 113979]|uniref:Cupin type-2 domain-containing protein n=1 Tax=Aulographum hederae CBS 113979 TaxID=1176131 RepID=A0A6G1GVQ4_9PEZI|nr:hypothetical protein K402DRAFT_119761 [Aulographum hederae CBS 113979]